MAEFIKDLELKKINDIVNKVNKIFQKVDVFCSALLLQAWRRIYFVSNKKEVYTSIEKRNGDCMRCGRCCQASLKCKHLAYDENGLSICKIHDRKPHMCKIYPYNRDDFFYHLKHTCGYKYD